MPMGTHVTALHEESTRNDSPGEVEPDTCLERGSGPTTTTASPVHTSETAYLGALWPGRAVCACRYITSERPWPPVCAAWSIDTPFMEMLVLKNPDLMATEGRLRFNY